MVLDSINNIMIFEILIFNFQSNASSLGIIEEQGGSQTSKVFTTYTIVCGLNLKKNFLKTIIIGIHRWGVKRSLDILFLWVFFV